MVSLLSTSVSVAKELCHQTIKVELRAASDEEGGWAWVERDRQTDRGRN